MKTTVNEFGVYTLTFPDGQPHVRLPLIYPPNGIITDIEEYTIRCSIRNPNELMQVMMINNILRSRPETKYVNIEIGYLMGARMDRPIDFYQPFTLKVVTDIINSGKFNSITLFNVHSKVSERLLRATNILPKNQINSIREKNVGIVLIAPDKGAVKWIDRIFTDYVVCGKTRDSQTGKLSGFHIEKPALVQDKDCLIIDDICDGGGTFVGLAEELKKAGAKRIILYVSHGIFSKGIPLPNIDEIWTTDSYADPEKYSHFPKDIIKFLPSF